jgi:hypothetical protein
VIRCWKQPTGFAFGRVRVSSGVAVMSTVRLIVVLFVLFVVAGLVLSCGASSQHQLQSITLSPQSADAKDYPNGQVQFIATGHYMTAPDAVTPITANWGACSPPIEPTSAVTVTSTGLAQCAKGAVGTYTVWANDPYPLPSGIYNCPAITACGGGCTVRATAQLTCP